MQLNQNGISQAIMDRPHGRYSQPPYKVALLFNDTFFSLTSFLVCALIFADQINVFHDLSHTATIVIFAMAAIAFFSPCKLYNYHIIYVTKTHVKLLVKVWGLNLFILFAGFGIYAFGRLANDVQFGIATIVLAILLLLLQKYFEEYSIHILMGIGISYILLGWIGLLDPESSAAITQAPLFMSMGLLLSTVTISLSRYLIVHQVFSKALRKKFRRQTVIIGSNEQAEIITRRVVDSDAPFWIAGVVGSQRGLGKTLRVAKENLGEVFNLPQIAEENRVAEVIITDEDIDKLTLIEILDYCASNRINVWFPPNYMPIINVKLYIDNFCGLDMIRLGTQKNHWLFSKLKNTFDALLTLPFFVLQLPFFLAIAAAVKMTSSGPVFYTATAVGKGGKLFSMYKFRSMAQNSDPAVHKQYVTKLIKGEIKNDPAGTKVLKLTDDNRITSIGRIIRKYSLDELPQLINVLKGDMSLVGPRPCLPYEYEAYEEWHKKRTAVRPGLSGLWQVTGRSEVSFEDMILLDLYYIYNRSFALDLSIIFETIFVVFAKKGAC
jgi:exopolysaccharide biosynthesis polyprenyl glycosylphosphotransferase